MDRNRQIKTLWQDALTGRISRRDIMRRGAALGLSATVVAALGQESLRATLAAEEGKPNATFYDWQFQIHPILYTIGDEEGVGMDVASSKDFSFERFVIEANDEKSTWDIYSGITPFLEMKPLADTGTIEPWTPYITEELKANLIPAAVEEGTYNGEFYVWPMVLDICVQAHHAGIIGKAGLDPEVLPKTWDELISNAQKVKDSAAAPYGLVFDNRDWRSLIPITHSFSTTDIYSPDGLFIYNSDPAVQALETMKRMMELTIPDALASMSVDNTNLPDEAAWAAEQAGYYFKYQNAPLFFSAPWPDPSQLRMAKLPSQEGTAGGTVFWSTGVGLLTFGANKEKMVDFVNKITLDQRFWQQSIAGIPEEAQPPGGQMPETNSIWDEWTNAPPDWITANPWVFAIKDSLAAAKAIQPSSLAITQFSVARPEWHKYLSGEVADAKTALTNAYDAVRAEFKKVTGVDAQ